ncbi:MAG TPA: hypothetical protein VFF67_10450, partial [Thermoplasmata archaeon]|nr:hypothetical protein [Thermoplasmata archaeon]
APKSAGRELAAAASDELIETVEDLRREQHEEREDRARLGSVARELDLRALLGQHVRAYTAFVRLLERLAFVVYPKFGYVESRYYARSYLMASIDALGRASSKPARWRVEQELTSPFLFRRLMGHDAAGRLERQWFAAYIEKHYSFPAFEALWKQLGGMDQQPRPS